MSEALINEQYPIGQVAGAGLDIPEQGNAPLLELVPEIAETSVVQEKRNVREWLTHIKRSGQTALVLAEITPGVNEGIRGALFAASEITTHSNPLMAGAVAGLSTFVIEAAGGAAGISLKNTPQGEWLTDKTDKALSRIKVPTKLSTSTKLWTTFMGGTNVGMLIEQREDPNRTHSQDVQYNYITSAWLGGALAVAGALSAEGINVGIDNPQITGGVTGLVGAAAAMRWLKKRFTKVEGNASEDLTDIDKKYKIDFAVTTDERKLAEAAKLEQDVWYKMGYGSLDEYEEHIADSRTITAYQDGKCVGLARMFDGTKRIMPFLEMDFYNSDLKEQIIEHAKNGKIVEMGTLAKAEDAPRGAVMRGILRLFYREAINRGAEEMACIMEPERVERINKRYGLTYRQVGPAIDYQGGWCAPHTMNIQEAKANMLAKRPLAYYWIVKRPLNK